MSALYAPVRQSLSAPRKPRSRLPKSVAPHTAWIRGRLLALGAITPTDADVVLSRCGERAKVAFRLGASSPGTQVYTRAELDDLLDVLAVIEAAPCTCEAQGLWAGVPRSRRRHAVTCPRWSRVGPVTDSA